MPGRIQLGGQSKDVGLKGSNQIISATKNLQISGHSTPCRGSSSGKPNALLGCRSLDLGLTVDGPTPKYASRPLDNTRMVGGNENGAGVKIVVAAYSFGNRSESVQLSGPRRIATKTLGKVIDIVRQSNMHANKGL
jgi:hypothetical protein